MGKKLDLSPDDSLLQIEDIHGDGLLTGCCCCGQQIQLFFDDLEDLPLKKIEDRYFYLFICDDCNDDIKFLIDNDIKNVSYDILWLIQRDLENELMEIEDTRSVLKEERDEILLRLYKELDQKISEIK